MINKILIYLLGASMLLFVACRTKVAAPEPFGPVPTESQLEWQKMEYYMFIHFGINTFTDKEWGDGKEDPEVFAPTELDCRQWAATAKAAGMTGIIITAKHHDGFCLWPSIYSSHTVRESNWKEGRGDVLKELSAACREFNLKFGVYLSPWDQNHPDYGTPAYNQIFANTLTEVLTAYGPVFEQWFDGANGEGEGGRKQKYDWDLFHKTVFKNQPNAIIFSDLGPGCRWIGNEQGFAGETNWSRLDVKGFQPGRNAPPLDTLNQGNKYGAEWVPGETDVSIRPGWFYSPSTDDKVKSLEQLLDIYYASVGRNSNLLLNVPPDRRGKIHSNDSTRLMELRAALDDDFKQNLAKDAIIITSTTRGKSRKFKAENLLDDNYDSYWATDDGVHKASVSLEFKQTKTFNRIVLQEYIPLGQRIARFNLEYWDDGINEWNIISDATTIGYKRIIKFPSVTSRKIRVNILNSLACPVLNNIEVYYAPENISMPVISRNKDGIVSIISNASDASVFYTTDGTEPVSTSLKYTDEFSFKEQGVIKAIAISSDGLRFSEVNTVQFDIAPTKWSIVAPTSPEAVKVIDGMPHSIAKLKTNEPLIIDFGEHLHLNGLVYYPENLLSASNIMICNLYSSVDGSNWGLVKYRELFDNIRNNPIMQRIQFDKTIKARFIKVEPVELTIISETYSIGEITVVTER